MVVLGGVALSCEVFLYRDYSKVRSTSLHHAKSFVGVFKNQFPSGLSTFDNNFPQNGSKNGAERGWDNPTKGLLWVGGC